MEGLRQATVAWNVNCESVGKGSVLATELWPNSMHVCSGKGGVPRCVIETRVITVIIP